MFFIHIARQIFRRIFTVTFLHLPGQPPEHKGVSAAHEDAANFITEQDQQRERNAEAQLPRLQRSGAEERVEGRNIRDHAEQQKFGGNPEQHQMIAENAHRQQALATGAANDDVGDLANND